MRKEECIGSFKFARSLLKFVLGAYLHDKIRPWLLRILGFSLVDSGASPTLGLNKDNSDYNT